MILDEDLKLKITIELRKSNVQITSMIVGKEEAVAGSVFLTYKGIYVLMSSGHTLEKHNAEEIGFKIKDIWFPFSEYSLPHYAIPKTNLHPDCALFVLSPAAVKALETEYKPIFIFEKDFRVLNTTPKNFTFVGYPAGKTKFYPTFNGIGRKPYSIWMNRETNRLESIKGEYGCDLFSFPFNRFKTIKGSEKRIEAFPKLQGISGSGLFSISVGLAKWDSDLIGIVNAYPAKEERIIGYYLSSAKSIFDYIVDSVEEANRMLIEQNGTM